MKSIINTLLSISLILILSSCTLYKVTSTKPDGNSIKVTVISGRNFEAPDLHYGKSEDGVEFDFKAAKTMDGNQAILQAVLSGALVVPK